MQSHEVSLIVNSLKQTTQTTQTTESINMLTAKQALKEIRKDAALVGLTFKAQTPALKINGFTSYMFIDRKTGGCVMYNCTLWDSYENVCSGYISSWNGSEFEYLGNYPKQDKVTK